jgi:hypothetical protein
MVASGYENIVAGFGSVGYLIFGFNHQFALQLPYFNMLPLVLSSVVIPAAALLFFVMLRAADSSDGICKILLAGSLDLSILSIGIAGGIFQNFKGMPDAGVYSPCILIAELILAASITVVTKRGREMGIIEEWKRALWALGLGVIAIAFPGCLILVYGRP